MRRIWSTVNELNISSNASNTSPNPSSNVTQMVPKQIVGIVDLANSVDNLSRMYKRQLELDTLSTEP